MGAFGQSLRDMGKGSLRNPRDHHATTFVKNKARSCERYAYITLTCMNDSC